MNDKNTQSDADKKADNMIKVTFTYRHKAPLGRSEGLWARRISKNTAKIESIPFFTEDLSLGDLVEFNEEGEVTKVLEHATRTRGMRYADDDVDSVEEMTEVYAALQDVLGAYDIYTECVVPGVCTISVPNDIDDDELARIAEQLDVCLNVNEEGRPCALLCQ